MRRVTYTTVFGSETDALSEARVNCELVDYTGAVGKKSSSDFPLICFTDQPIKSKAWEIVKLKPARNPQALNRQIKLLWHETFPDAVDCLYCDANFRIDESIEKVSEIGKGLFYNHRHHKRTRISQEAPRIAEIGKANTEAVFQQLRCYREQGFDTNKNPQQSLSCNCVLYRRKGTEELCERWWAELEKHTLRDQMSLDFVAWRTGFAIDRWRGNIHNTALGALIR